MIDKSYAYKVFSRYPSTFRDIALVVDEKIAYTQISSIISQFPLVTQLILFDLYRGEQVPIGKKSLAFRIIFQSIEHTLADEEIDEIQRDILYKLQNELGASLRIC